MSTESKKVANWDSNSSLFELSVVNEVVRHLEQKRIRVFKHCYGCTQASALHSACWRSGVACWSENGYASQSWLNMDTVFQTCLRLYAGKRYTERLLAFWRSLSERKWLRFAKLIKYGYVSIDIHGSDIWGLIGGRTVGRTAAFVEFFWEFSKCWPLFPNSNPLLISPSLHS